MILHLCNDFLGSKVHKELYSHLDELNMEQIIFAPIRRETDRGKNTFNFKVKGSILVYSNLLKKYHRILFRQKIKYLYKSLKRDVDLYGVDVIHATTLFSDGALALKLYKKFNIPYVVSVRSVDVSIFLRYRPDLLLLAYQILINASHIIFISESLKNNMYKHPLLKCLYSKLAAKSQVIYNGIDSYWIQNFRPKQELIPKNILYVGNFSRNKNVYRLIQAFLRIKEKYPYVKLNLVGSNGEQELRVRDVSKEHNDSITWLGPIFDKHELLNVFRNNHIFSMVSIRETFGLVYIEALSQGLPIVFTKEQGIDGVFQSQVGESVRPKSIESIEEGLLKVLKDYPAYVLEQDDLNKFNWITVSNKYKKIYESIF